MNVGTRAIVPIVAILIAGCGEADVGSETTTDSTATIQPSTTSTALEGDTTTTMEGAVMGEAELVEVAVADLSERLGVSEDGIELVEVRSVQWPDGALGCPEEGVMYTQAIVDGHQIILQANERVYTYHSGTGKEPFLCPSDERDGGYDFVPPPGFDER